MKRKNKSKLKEVVNEYFELTTIGALPQVYFTRYGILKLLWFFVFCLGLCLTIFHTYQIVQTYLSYPIKVQVYMRSNESLEFPAVTICNLNPVKKSNIRCSKHSEIAAIQEKFTINQAGELIKKYNPAILAEVMNLMNEYEEICNAGNETEENNGSAYDNGTTMSRPRENDTQENGSESTNGGPVTPTLQQEPQERRRKRYVLQASVPGLQNIKSKKKDVLKQKKREKRQAGYTDYADYSMATEQYNYQDYGASQVTDEYSNPDQSSYVVTDGPPITQPFTDNTGIVTEEYNYPGYGASETTEEYNQADQSSDAITGDPLTTNQAFPENTEAVTEEHNYPGNRASDNTEEYNQPDQSSDAVTGDSLTTNQAFPLNTGAVTEEYNYPGYGASENTEEYNQPDQSSDAVTGDSLTTNQAFPLNTGAVTEEYNYPGYGASENTEEYNQPDQSSDAISGDSLTTNQAFPENTEAVTEEYNYPGYGASENTEEYNQPDQSSDAVTGDSLTTNQAFPENTEAVTEEYNYPGYGASENTEEYNQPDQSSDAITGDSLTTNQAFPENTEAVTEEYNYPGYGASENTEEYNQPDQSSDAITGDSLITNQAFPENTEAVTEEYNYPGYGASENSEEYNQPDQSSDAITGDSLTTNQAFPQNTEAVTEEYNYLGYGASENTKEYNQPDQSSDAITGDSLTTNQAFPENTEAVTEEYNYPGYGASENTEEYNQPDQSSDAITGDSLTTNQAFPQNTEAVTEEYNYSGYEASENTEEYNQPDQSSDVITGDSLTTNQAFPENTEPVTEEYNHPDTATGDSLTTNQPFAENTGVSTEEYNYPGYAVGTEEYNYPGYGASEITEEYSHPDQHSDAAISNSPTTNQPFAENTGVGTEEYNYPDYAAGTEEYNYPEYRASEITEEYMHADQHSDAATGDSLTTNQPFAENTGVGTEEYNYPGYAGGTEEYNYPGHEESEITEENSHPDQHSDAATGDALTTNQPFAENTGVGTEEYNYPDYAAGTEEYNYPGYGVSEITEEYSHPDQHSDAAIGDSPTTNQPFAENTGVGTEEYNYPGYAGGTEEYNDPGHEESEITEENSHPDQHSDAATGDALTTNQPFAENTGVGTEEYNYPHYAAGTEEYNYLDDGASDNNNEYSHTDQHSNITPVMGDSQKTNQPFAENTGHSEEYHYPNYGVGTEEYNYPGYGASEATEEYNNHPDQNPHTITDNPHPTNQPTFSIPVLTEGHNYHDYGGTEDLASDQVKPVTEPSGAAYNYDDHEQNYNPEYDEGNNNTLESEPNDANYNYDDGYEGWNQNPMVSEVPADPNYYDSNGYDNSEANASEAGDQNFFYNDGKNATVVVANVSEENYNYYAEENGNTEEGYENSEPLDEYLESGHTEEGEETSDNASNVDDMDYDNDNSDPLADNSGNYYTNEEAEETSDDTSNDYPMDDDDYPIDDDDYPMDDDDENSDPLADYSGNDNNEGEYTSGDASNDDDDDHNHQEFHIEEELNINGEEGNDDLSDYLKNEYSRTSWLQDITGDNKYNFTNFLTFAQLQDLKDIMDLAAFTTSEFQQYGYSYDDLIAECTIDRAPCNVSQFAHTTSNKYGNCYTFNRDLNSQLQTHVSRRGGSQYGLRLTLNINASEYIGLLAPEYGIRVSIHPSDTRPVPEDFGFEASPGEKTSVALRRMEIKRLSLPYETNCTSEFPSKFKAYTDQQTRYSLSLCKMSCKDYYLHQKCGCVEKMLNNETLGVSLCDFFNATQRTCRLLVEARFYLPSDNPKALNCYCQPKCHEVDYLKTISHAVWPSDAYMQLKILNFMNQHKVADIFMTSSIAREWDAKEKYVAETGIEPPTAEDNLVRLHVYYESLTYELVEELPGYPMSQLWADFGGVVGLYLGMTAATAIEVIQLFVLAGVSCFKKRPKNSVAEDNESGLTGIYEDNPTDFAQPPPKINLAY